MIGQHSSVAKISMEKNVKGETGKRNEGKRTENEMKQNKGKEKRKAKVSESSGRRNRVQGKVECVSVRSEVTKCS